MSYDLVRQVLHDPSCLTGSRVEWVNKLQGYASNRNIDFDATSAIISSMLIQINPPDHTELRSLLAKNWPTKDLLSAMAQQLSTDIAGKLPKQFNLVTAIAKKLPMQMICHVLGFPSDQGERHLNDGLRLVQLLGPYLSFRDLLQTQKAAERLLDSFQNFYDTVDPNKPANLSAKIKQAYRNNGRKQDEAVTLLIFLFIAGFETTSTLLSQCLLLLLNNKALLGKMDQPSLPAFVSEVLRLHSPVQITGRKTSQEMVLGGVHLPVGSILTLCVGAANRDPKHFKNPDALDISRDSKQHLSFGYGIHHCLGSQMAQIEAIEMLKIMIPILGQFNLTGPIKWENKLTIRSVREINVTRNG